MADDAVSNTLVRTIADAVVIGIVFPDLAKTLIVDTRRDDTDGPAVLLEGRIDSPQDLLQAIRRHRPAFADLSQFTYARWKENMAAFAESGVRQAIIDRLQMLDAPEAILAANAAFATFR